MNRRTRAIVWAAALVATGVTLVLVFGGCSITVYLHLPPPVVVERPARESAANPCPPIPAQPGIYRPPPHVMWGDETLPDSLAVPTPGTLDTMPAVIPGRVITLPMGGWILAN